MEDDIGGPQQGEGKGMFYRDNMEMISAKTQPSPLNALHTPVLSMVPCHFPFLSQLVLHDGILLRPSILNPLYLRVITIPSKTILRDGPRL